LPSRSVSTTRGVTGRREVHADRPPLAGRVVPEELRVVFQAVAVGVPQQVELAVIRHRDERAVRPVFDVVDVRQLDRQFANGEAGKKHLHGGGIRDRDQRLAARVAVRREHVLERGML
jgi:hypothetical protein